MHALKQEETTNSWHSLQQENVTPSHMQPIHKISEQAKVVVQPTQRFSQQGQGPIQVSVAMYCNILHMQSVTHCIASLQCGYGIQAVVNLNTNLHYSQN